MFSFLRNHEEVAQVKTVSAGDYIQIRKAHVEKHKLLNMIERKQINEAKATLDKLMEKELENLSSEHCILKGYEANTADLVYITYFTTNCNFLHTALVLGMIELASQILERCAGFMSQEDLANAYIISVCNGDEFHETCKKYITHNESFLQKVIHAAVACSNVDAAVTSVLELLKLQNKEGKTVSPLSKNPLSITIECAAKQNRSASNDIERIYEGLKNQEGLWKKLLQSGSSSELTPLESTVTVRDHDALRKLLLYGAEMDPSRNAYYLAVKMGDTNAMKILANRFDMAKLFPCASSGCQNFYQVLPEGEDGDYVFQIMINQFFTKYQLAKQANKNLGSFGDFLYNASTGKAMLHYIAQSGTVNHLKIYEQVVGDLSNVTKNNENYLHIAAQNGQAAIIKYRAAMGYQTLVDAETNNGRTAYEEACVNGHVELAMELFPWSTVSTRINRDGDNPLHMLVKMKGLKRFALDGLRNKFRVKGKWDPKFLLALRMQNGVKMIPLHFLAENPCMTPSEQWVQVFTMKDCALHRDRQGQTALLRGLKERNYEVAYDIAYESNMGQDVADSDGKIPLHHAIEAICEQNTVSPNTHFKDLMKKIIENTDDLAKRDQHLDSPLHVLVKELKNHPEYTEDYMEVFNDIIKLAKERIDIIQSSSSSKSLLPKFEKRKVFEELLIKRVPFFTSDGYKASVLFLAVQEGLTDFVDHCLKIEQVSSEIIEEVGDEQPNKIGYNYNVSGYLPTTSSHDGDGAWSLVEYMIKNNQWQMLKLEPIEKSLDSHWQPYTMIYFLALCAHITYMALLSHYSTTEENFRLFNETVHNERSVPPNLSLLWTLIWPLAIFLYDSSILCLHCMKHSKGKAFFVKQFFKDARKLGPLRTLESISFKIVDAVFVLSVIIWQAFYHAGDANQDKALAIALIFGWIHAIQFTQAFQSIHHYSLVLQRLIFRDIAKFCVVFLFLMLGYSFAFYALTRRIKPQSEEITDIGKALFLSFGWTLGTEDFWSFEDEDTTPDTKRLENFIRITYISYMILFHVILLNMLIAIMNSSFSEVEGDQKEYWRHITIHDVFILEGLIGESKCLRKVFFGFVHLCSPNLSKESGRLYVLKVESDNESPSEVKSIQARPV